MIKDKVNHLLQNALADNPNLFLIDLSISDQNKINVTIDGDNGVTLQDCINISRAIEHNLDREEEDFSLEVASAGATSPLKLHRQYVKNIGRTLEVKTTSGEQFEGELTAANQDNFCIEWLSREPKKIGKGKETVKHSKEFAYTDIKEAKVIIVF
ncbi:MAG: ribosome assembly cofactor RimP [Bacteroidota bacterium]|nr:ribosome assembly cofactor RimP [Bacteroidota bacterium]